MRAFVEIELCFRLVGRLKDGGEKWWYRHWRGERKILFFSLGIHVKQQDTILSVYHCKYQVGAKARCCVNGKLRTRKSYVRGRSFLNCAGCAKLDPSLAQNMVDELQMYIRLCLHSIFFRFNVNTEQPRELDFMSFDWGKISKFTVVWASKLNSSTFPPFFRVYESN